MDRIGEGYEQSAFGRYKWVYEGIWRAAVKWSHRNLDLVSDEDLIAEVLRRIKKD